MSKGVVLAVDGGNSKTDLALARTDGSLLGLARGPRSSPQHLGADGCIAVLEGLLDNALRDAGLERDTGPVAEVAHLLLAGVDFPSDIEQVQQVAAARGWAQRLSVANDTFAVLRAGTERGWGVAIVCGAGINCVGVTPDGRHARFLSLGEITGDWGGGYDVGIAAGWAAARSEDGRGAKSTLEQSVPRHFGLETPAELAEAFHRQQISLRRVTELPRLVFSEAEHDAVAAEIVDRLAEEVVALARAALTRLDLIDQAVDVLLGGSILRAGNDRLMDAIAAGVREVGQNLVVHAADSPPVVGAALLGLDELGADADAQARLRRELTAAVQERALLASPGGGARITAGYAEVD